MMNFIRTILLTLMMTTPVMANGIDDREQFYDDIYDAYYNAIRENRMKDRTPAEDSINKALMEFYYGSNGATESEELLQLPSDEDQQSS